jgi:hypothetical protein
MEISIILEELYARVSLFFRHITLIISQTIHLSKNAISCKITVKKRVRHDNQTIYYLCNLTGFSKTVGNCKAGSEITNFYSALVETVTIPQVKNPSILIADTPGGIDVVPDFFRTTWQRKGGPITLLENSPILFFSSGGNRN